MNSRTTGSRIAAGSNVTSTLAVLGALLVVNVATSCPPEESAAASGPKNEVYSSLDPAGRPIRVTGDGTKKATADVAVVSGADPSYAHDPLPRNGGMMSTADEIRRIKREHFGGVRSQERRDEGIAKLGAFRESSGITAMYEELRAEKDDVVLGMLNHIASLGESGQAALAWMAIMDTNPALRHEASNRLRQPATPATLGVIDAALRSDSHMVANRAGSLAGAIGAVQAIPLLIAAQSEERTANETGDLAWIAIQTQRSYVANVVPVVGDNAGAFQPIIGVIGEGAVLRIMDAVVITYRTEIHTSLVGLTSADWGKSTEHLGYDRVAWQRWYEEEYKPFLARRADEASRLARAKQLEREAASEEDQ
jgi:hypothetical protein